jgi:hypothetical protein
MKSHIENEMLHLFIPDRWFYIKALPLITEKQLSLKVVAQLYLPDP